MQYYASNGLHSHDLVVLWGMELAKYRKQAGLTQAELGRKLGVFNRQTVGAWEADPDNMKHGTMKAYASACGVTVADLMGFDGEAQQILEDVYRLINGVWPESPRPLGESGFDRRMREINERFGLVEKG